ncbi:MAG TPA: M4 family metallopeptidase, partial [Aggregatilineaceae bacterium]|nr:M4 family metallopeptidase [Aggregatilineaceae bacterium]
MNTATPTLASPPQQGDDQLRIVVHDQTGYYTFVGIDSAEFNQALPGATAFSGAPTARVALADISKYAGQFGLKDASQELRFNKVSQGINTSFRYQQVYQGIPVVAGELLVNYDGRGRLAAIAGEVSPNLAISTTPTVSVDQAKQTALRMVAAETGIDMADLEASAPELWIYDARLLMESDFPAHLVWRLEVKPTFLAPVDYLVLVNARLGAISLAFNQRDTSWGTGQTSTSQNRAGLDVSITLPPKTWSVSMPATTYNSNHTPSTRGAGSSTVVCSTLPAGLSGAGSCDGTSTYSAANAAQFFAVDTAEYYKVFHNRNSINNLGMALISNVNYREDASEPYDNAGWTGEEMVYGDGDFYTVDDVIGHELSHGVTQYESNLFYFYESGAINEMFSDIFGEFVDQWNNVNRYGVPDPAADRWLMGEDMAMGAMRNMKTPAAGNPPQPDRTQSTYFFYWKSTSPYWDNGGVHINSGVGNKAAYLMTDGGTFNGYTITALGMAKTSALFYEVNSTLLTGGADYEALGAALVQACNNIRSGANPLGMTEADCNEVSDAVLATQMNIDPVAAFDYTPKAGTCNTGLGPYPYLFNDNFEAGMGN